MKKNEATWTFLNLVLTKLAVPGLWRLYFGVLSRQISFWTFLELQLTILACKLYVSCACCVNIKFRVHVYSVFVWISLDSLVAVAVSVCRVSFASLTQQWHDDIYNTRRNWKHLPSLILHSKLIIFVWRMIRKQKKICKLWIYERNEHVKNWTQNVPFGHLKFRCLLFQIRH